MKFPERIKWRHVKRLYGTLEPHLKASPVKSFAPERGRALVLSPHIDDDVIGCGGCLRKHVEAGDEVMSVYFADCTEERILEAKEANSVIGFSRMEFFEYPSKTLRSRKELPERLFSIIDSYRPEIVYLPSFLDRHNDHLAVNHLLSLYYISRKRDLTVCAFEVWTTFVPNLIVDITSVIEKKKEALSSYKSQLAWNNWQDAAISLNRYRGVVSGVGEFAEGYIRYSLKDYSRLLDSVFHDGKD